MRIKHLSPERRGLDIHLGVFILNPDPANDGMLSKPTLNPPVAPAHPKISLSYSATQQDRKALPQATVSEEGTNSTKESLWLITPYNLCSSPALALARISLQSSFKTEIIAE